jgi:hypothetical protein
MKRGKRGRKSSPKQSLNLPDLDNAKSAVLNSLPSKESQRGYRGCGIAATAEAGWTLRHETAYIGRFRKESLRTRIGNPAKGLL